MVAASEAALEKHGYRPFWIDENNKFHVEWRFPKQLKGLHRKARFKGFWGGRGSGKTQNVAAWVVQTCVEGLVDPETGKRYGPRVLGCREIQLSIADSTKQEIEDQIDKHGLRKLFISTKTEIRGPRGARIFFAGLHRNISNIKSKASIDIVWVDEAQSVTQDSIDKLIPTIRKRGSQIVFTWNPEDPSDPVDYLLRSEEPLDPDPEMMRDYEIWQLVERVNPRDNPWFPDVLKASMEIDRRRDPDKYAHIWLGEYKRVSEARVFKNWRVGDIAEFDKFVLPGENNHPNASIRVDKLHFGADWGMVDPNVLVRCFIHGRQLYIDREVVLDSVDIDDIPFLFAGFDPQIINLNREAYSTIGQRHPSARVKWKGISGSRKWRITGDSARPETISYLNRHGFPQMIAARKGSNSVMEGIEFMKTYDIVVHPECVTSIDEMSTYSWTVDAKTNPPEILPVLEDKKNHVIDAIRYAVESTRRAQASFNVVHF